MTEDTYIGAVDQGTTGTRFMVFDHGGRVVARTYERHEQIYPQPGWVEHDPVEIWENAKSTIIAGLAAADLDADQLAALGVANQRETTVLWDAETGGPCHNAIVWQDRRTTDRIAAIRESDEADWIRERTGLEPDAYFSATKAEWLLDHLAETSGSPRAAGELLLGTIDSWLVYNLTGEHVTDVTNASRTMLFNIHELDWDDELLATFGVPRDLLPAVRPSSDVDGYGRTVPAGFLGTDVPVTAALGDQQAALFGQAGFERGAAKNTYGTGSFYLMNTGTEPVTSDHGLVTTIAFQLSDGPVHYALEGSIFVTGAAIEWLADIGIIDEPTETAALAAAVESTDGVYLVPAFAGLGAPYWDGRARGTIVGLTRGTRREHIVRAALESIAFQTRDIAEAMEADMGIEGGTLRVDGGAAKNDVLCQLQSDILQTDIARPTVDETTALGAAYAAGLAIGYWETVDQLMANWEIDRWFEPERAAAEADARYGRWKNAVDRSLDWAPNGTPSGHPG